MPQFVQELITAASTPLSAIEDVDELVRELLITYMKTCPRSLQSTDLCVV